MTLTEEQREEMITLMEITETIYTKVKPIEVNEGEARLRLAGDLNEMFYHTVNEHIDELALAFQNTFLSLIELMVIKEQDLKELANDYETKNYADFGQDFFTDIIEFSYQAVNNKDVIEIRDGVMTILSTMAKDMNTTIMDFIIEYASHLALGNTEPDLKLIK